MQTNYISPVILSRLPSFVKTDYPLFYQFISHYYAFLEEQGNPLEVLETLAHNLETNNEVDIYIDVVLKELGWEVKLDPMVPKSELVVHLRDFYLSRGSENSFKFLFKVLFGIDPEIEYPRDRLLVPSQANYTGNHFIYTTATNIGTDDHIAILNQASDYSVTVTGVSSGVVSSVEAIFVESKNGVFYLKIQIDSEFKLYFNEESVRLQTQDGDFEIVESLVQVVTLDITNGGSRYKIGERVTIENTNIQGFASIRTLVPGSIESLTINDGGLGYVIGDPIKTTNTQKGHSFSAAVSAVDNGDNRLQLDPHADLELWSGDFTIECWIYIEKGYKDVVIIKTRDNDAGWKWKIDGTNRPYLRWLGPGEWEYRFTSFANKSIEPRTWTHIAVTRSGDYIYHFQNGRLRGFDIVPTGLNGLPSLEDIHIGNRFVGYIDELRVTNVARYTNDFDLPLAPFDNTDELWDDVGLLLNAEDLTDSSNNSMTITVPLAGNIFVSEKESRFGTESIRFTGWGTISAVTIYSGGFNFEEIPDLEVVSVNPDASNADIEANSNSIGQIKSIEFVEPFVDPIGVLSVSIDTENGSGATFDILTDNVLFNELKTHRSFEGFIGVNSTVHDSFYWQQFSYLVRSGLPRLTYDNVVNEYLHPAGYVRFAIYENFFSGTIYPLDMTHMFYLTIVKLIHTNIVGFMVNPLYHLNWLKDQDLFKVPNFEFDYYQEEWLTTDDYYMSPTLDATIDRIFPVDMDEYLVNPFHNVEEFKVSPNWDEPNSYLDNYTMLQLSDNSILFQDALQIEILTYTFNAYAGETADVPHLYTQMATGDLDNYAGEAMTLDTLD